MNLAVKLNRSKAADFLIALLAMTPAVAIYYSSLSPHAAVYFTFIRNFFDLPFSYQPGTVSFGATSPLHVLIHAPIYAVLGQHWLPVSKFLSLLMVTCGVVFINRALRGGTKTVLLISLLVAVSTALLNSAAQLFETGLSFLAVSWLYHDLVHKKYNRASLISGLLYLVRPELVFVTIATLIYTLVQSEERKRIIVLTAVGLFPAILYHVYILVSAGTPLPGSAFTPIISYIHDSTSWLHRLGVSLSSLWSASGLIYIAGTIAALLLIADRTTSRYTQELLLAAPLIVLYFVFPPQEDIARYLVPTIPLMIATIVRYVQQNLKAQYTVNALVVCLVLAHGYGIAARASTPNHDARKMLMQDLSAGLAPINPDHAPVLLDEIQGQYAIDAPCFPMDASVGNAMIDVLLKRSSMPAFIQQHGIRFVVTGHGDLPQGGYSNDLMRVLRDNDYPGDIGDTVYADGLAFQKVLSNPIFIAAQARNVSLYSERAITGQPSNLVARWNSVYTVLGIESDIRAEQAALQQQIAAADSLAIDMNLDSPGSIESGPGAAPPAEPVSTAPATLANPNKKPGTAG